MEKQVNREYLNKVRDYIRNDKATYTFEKFFKDNNLLEGSIDNGNEIKLNVLFTQMKHLL